MDVQIPLRNERREIVAHVLIDATDAPFIEQWTWSLHSAGYAWRSQSRRPRHVFMHRVLMELEQGDGLFVDHINRDKLDNRRANLRVVTPAESRQNTPALGRSARGVGFDRARGLWRAQAQLDRRNHFIGRFHSEAEAAAAAREWRLAHMPFTVEESA